MDDLLLTTDLDGTLLDGAAEVPPACMEAIAAYVRAGGLFTVATGRPTRGALLYSGLMELVNAPLITYNGACIFDRKAGRAVWRELLPDSAAELIRSALDRVPDVGALIFRGEDDFTCVVRENAYTREVSWNRERYRAMPQSLEKIPQPWNKAVLSGPPEAVAACADFVRAHAPGPLTTILSEGKFLELTGPNAGKGRALRRVAERLGLPQDRVVAVGDSMNDIEMLRWAGTGVAVANAEEEILRVAGTVVASNVDHGICECIEKIALPLLLRGGAGKKGTDP